MLTPEQLQQLREKAEAALAAVPFRWMSDGLRFVKQDVSDQSDLDSWVCSVMDKEPTDARRLTSYIAAAQPSVVLALLDEVESSREQIKQAREAWFR